MGKLDDILSEMKVRGRWSKPVPFQQDKYTRFVGGKVKAKQEIKDLMLELIGEPDARYDNGRYNMTIELRRKVNEL